MTERDPLEGMHLDEGRKPQGAEIILHPERMVNLDNFLSIWAQVVATAGAKVPYATITLHHVQLKGPFELRQEWNGDQIDMAVKFDQFEIKVEE